MLMKTVTNIRFKEITSQQLVLFPSNIGDKIAANHPVRLVNQVIDSLNIDNILATYKGGGTSSYSPRMMLKVLFYSYFNNIYSCRKIEKLLTENIHFIWLCGDNAPDFRTINDFRSKRLKGQIQELFSGVVKLIHELGYISLDIQFVDGTKLEAASNKYTFVWKKSVERNKANLESKIQSVLGEINSAIKEDCKSVTTIELPKTIDSKEIALKVAELNQHIEQLNKEKKKQIKKLINEQLPKLKEYEDHLQILGDRNSYSKTDSDATFMRMKDDHMMNGQLKPAYNVQISTENQFVTNFSMHQRPGDTATLTPHLEQFKELYNKQSKKVVADAGYGSEQNYQWSECNGIEAFIKYNMFHKEQKKAFKNDAFASSNLFYNPDKNYLVCPMGQRMLFVGQQKRVSELGNVTQISIYKAIKCDGCPLRGECHNAQGNRQVELNHKLIAYRKQARERLLSAEGRDLRGRRAIEPEAVFGQIKSNNKFNRFTLRGLEKTEIEFGIVSISHNLRKLAQAMSKNQN